MKKPFTLINLIPYREIEKTKKIKLFVILIGMFVSLGLLINLLFWVYLKIEIKNQEDRNSFIMNENKKLDETIKSIAKLKEEIALTLSKRKIVEDLQVDRADGINIINTVANNLPEDTYLNNLKKNGNNITIIGQTISNNKVSHYMTSLEGSEILKNVVLKEIKAKNVVVVEDKKQKNKPSTRSDKISEFSLAMEMEKAKEEQKEKVGVKK